MQAPVGNLSTRSCSGVSRAVLTSPQAARSTVHGVQCVRARKRHAVLCVLRADARKRHVVLCMRPSRGRATRVAGPDDCYEQPVQMTPMRSRSPPVCLVLTISSADLVHSMIIQGFWGSLLLLAQKFTNNFLQLTHYSKKLAGAVLNFRTR